MFQIGSETILSQSNHCPGVRVWKYLRASVLGHFESHLPRGAENRKMSIQALCCVPVLVIVRFTSTRRVLGHGWI